MWVRGFCQLGRKDSVRRSAGCTIQRGTTAVASISTRAALSTRRTTWTNAIAGRA
jgi:hypothetical protein